MTLLELTVVILFLLSLVTILFWGGQAWKRGSDRTICIMNIHTVQKGVRSFANLNGLDIGENVVGLENYVIGPGLFVESLPSCPALGNYTLSGDVIPAVGQLYMTCSLAADGHEPVDYAGW